MSTMKALAMKNIKMIAFFLCFQIKFGVDCFTILEIKRATIYNLTQQKSSAAEAEIPQIRAPTISIVTNEEEINFKAHTKALCEERNIKFDNVKNARDLSSAKNSPIVSGRIFRMGRVSNASQNDKKILLEDMNIKTFIDLRSETELKEDETINSPIFNGFRTIKWGPGSEKSSENDGGYERKRTKRKLQKSLTRTLKFEDDPIQGRKERHFVSMMNELKYVKGTLSKIRRRDLAQAVLQIPGAIFSKRVRNRVKDIFLSEINGGGLTLLNELLLKMGAPGIKRVLRIMADKNRHPIGFYCTAGKDRTGIIAAIILSLVGVDDEDVVEDYSLSANVYAEMGDHKAMVGALSQRNLDAEVFLGAPPHVMRETLINIRKNFGSVEGYLDWIGFDDKERESLKNALIAP